MNKRLLYFCYAFFCMVSVSNAQTKPLNDADYVISRNGLETSFQKFKQGKQATVAFLGGSITFNPGWREMVCADLQKRFPETSFHFIAAGIPSLGSLPHAFRLKQDVLDSGKVDLLFLEAAVNDQVNGTDSLTQLRALEGIVRHVKTANPKTDIVMMSFADPDKTKMYDNGHIPTSIVNHELIAAHYQLPSLNLAKAVHDRLANKEFDWDKDFKDLHPSPFGQALYFEAIKTLLNLNFDASNKKNYPNSGKLPGPLIAKNFERGKYVNIDKALFSKDWTLNKDWTPKDGLSTRDGFVHVPVLEATNPGAALEFRFKGNAVGISIVSGSDAGIIGYSIDHGPEQQLDLYTNWSNSLHLPWYLLLGGNLKEGNHVLKLHISEKHNTNSKGNACRIVHFLVN